MTPEELKEFREWCRTFEVPADSMIMKALEHIDQQAKQIAALQEIAAEQKAAHIAFVGFHRNMNEDETKNKAQDEARRQLAKEHPEAFR